jgi:hypothetical protein
MLSPPGMAHTAIAATSCVALNCVGTGFISERACVLCLYFTGTGTGHICVGVTRARRGRACLCACTLYYLCCCAGIIVGAMVFASAQAQGMLFYLCCAHYFLVLYRHRHRANLCWECTRAGAVRAPVKHTFVAQVEGTCIYLYTACFCTQSKVNSPRRQ